MSPAPAPSFPPLMGYIPREHIASGGQSSVWRALNLSTEHHAAMKVVPLRISAASSDAQTAAKAKQLVREMRIHETLQHRNILRLFGGETREDCTVRAENGGETTWPSGLYMLLDLGEEDSFPFLFRTPFMLIPFRYLGPYSGWRRSL